jgi:hypothetical protein
MGERWISARIAGWRGVAPECFESCIWPRIPVTEGAAECDITPVTAFFPEKPYLRRKFFCAASDCLENIPSAAVPSQCKQQMLSVSEATLRRRTKSGPSM